MKTLNILLYFALILLLSCSSKKNSKTKVITLVETSKSWNGTPLPKYLEGNPKVTILKITIPPKTRLETHKHSEINAGVLLKGELTVISENNDTLYLKAGDPIVELVNTWHYGENNGTEPAEIIVFYAGVEGTPITIIKDEN
ncbi:cupin domain-containing protein [Aquimarina sp. Aq78]|uniref:cupin domain-containing protein n=1 Tax=Aquimarina sp. Aq78 TaxID=1191889 RepID=UPI000D0F1E61|nr:cupin domain-containing protein [Aquimarina sp. Aq78]